VAFADIFGVNFTFGRTLIPKAVIPSHAPPYALNNELKTRKRKRCQTVYLVLIREHITFLRHWRRVAGADTRPVTVVDVIGAKVPPGLSFAPYFNNRTWYLTFHL
jgi:hypothetical protein